MSYLIAESAQPGDLLLIKTNHFVSKVIRWGQRDYGKEAIWNHVAVVVGNRQIVEALTKGVVLSSIDKYLETDVRVLSVKAQLLSPNFNQKHIIDTAMRANARAFACSCVGQSYGWLTIAAIVLKIFTKGRLGFGISGTSICSGLAARSLERLGYDWNPWDPAELTPAFLASYLCG